MNVLNFPNAATLKQEQLSADEEWELIEKLSRDVGQLLDRIGGYGHNEARAQNFLRYHFNVSSHAEMTIGQMKKAIPLLKQTLAQIQEFDSRIYEIKKAFGEQVVGRGVPWTPWITRKLGRRRMAKEGKNPNWAELMKELEGEISELS